MKHNILKVTTVTPKLHLCDPNLNALEMIKILKETNSDIVVFPELSLSGYTCGDYFYQKELIDDINDALKALLAYRYDGIYIFGMPLFVDGSLFNVAVVVDKNKIIGVIPKYYNPNTNEFNEKRYFSSGLDLNLKKVKILDKEVPFGKLLFNDNYNQIKFGVEICQDMWMILPPNTLYSLAGANMIINLSASNEHVGKSEIRKNIVKEQSRKNVGAYVYTSSGVTESTSETVFSGHNIVSVCGEIINEQIFLQEDTYKMTTDIDFGYINTTRFKDTSVKDLLYKFDLDFKVIDINFKEEDNFILETINKSPLLPVDNKETFNEIRNIQYFGLIKRLNLLNNPKVIIGISGGLDSSYTLVLLADIFKRSNRDLKDIIAISMPGLHTSNKTKDNARLLSESLGVKFVEIDIKEEVKVQFKMIKQDIEKQDITYENVQARIRTQTLMNLANKENGIVIGTGSLSEIALGFMTYNADMMSMYAINSGMPKTLIQRQFKNYITIFPKLENLITDILKTPISAELKRNQETEKFLGTYEINDFLIYRHLVCGDKKEKMTYLLKNVFKLSKKDSLEYVNRFIERFYNNQYKRQVMPDGPKIINFNLSPRSDYKLNSDVKIK